MPSSENEPEKPCSSSVHGSKLERMNGTPTRSRNSDKRSIVHSKSGIAVDGFGLKLVAGHSEPCSVVSGRK